MAFFNVSQSAACAFHLLHTNAHFGGLTEGLSVGLPYVPCSLLHNE